MASPKKVLAPIDPDVRMPPGVLAAKEAAEALHKSLYEPPVDPAAAPAPGLVISSEPVPAPPAPAPVTLEGNEPAPAAPAAPAEPPRPAPIPDETWEHKYSSMKGRWERSENANRALTERLSGLEQVVATMAVTAPIPASAAAAPSAASLITPEERAEFGDDFIRMAGKIAEESWAPKVNSLEAELKILRDRLEGVGAYVGQTERERMHSYLTQHVPNWLEVNDDPEFIRWLGLPEPLTGVIKNTVLQEAYARNEAPRVLAFFQGFLNREAALAPRTEQPAPAPAAVKVPLETFAAPGRAKTAATPQVVPAEKPILNRADVTQFYVDVSNKKYVGREDEKARLDAMIIEAGREGRIR